MKEPALRVAECTQDELKKSVAFVGPTGFVPAALFTALIVARLSFAPAAGKPGGKHE